MSVSIIGSPLYQAPEITEAIDNDRELSMTADQVYAMDVYSLGRTLLQMLTGYANNCTLSMLTGCADKCMLKMNRRSLE